MRREFTDEQKAAQGNVMKIYKESSPVIETLFEWAYINHVAWSLAAVLLGVVVWLVVALTNAENQRNALITKQCADRSSRASWIANACARSTRASIGGST